VYLNSDEVTLVKIPDTITDTELKITYNANDFAPRSRVEVKITFNGDEFYLAPEFISISKRFELDRLSQEIISKAATKVLLYVKEDLEAAGGIWDTQENLKWSYNNGAYIEQAYYISNILVSCDLPTTTLPSLDVKLIIDETNNFESTNFLTISFVDSPIVTSIATFEVDGQRFANITGSGFMNSPNNMIYTLFTNGQLIEFEAASDTDIQIPIPVLNPGSTIDDIYISIDKNYFSSYNLGSPIIIDEWIAPRLCIGIPDASFLWGPGYVASTIDFTLWEPCSDGTDGKYCPFSGGTPQDCPPGFACTNTTDRIESEFQETPDGYYLDLPTNTLIACPPGKWWGKGVFMDKHVSGEMKSPQICNDGIVCGQTIDGSMGTGPGSKDAYGNFDCPTSKFCQQGLPTDCYEGYFCPVEGLREPEICPSGFFSGAGQTECNKCSIGTLWPDVGSTTPIQCSPGSVCNLNAQLGITSLCPAGSYWVSKTVTSRSNYTAIAEDYIPIYCLSGTYCLSGVYTPVVDSDNPQAAQNCIEGSYCPEGTDSPRGIPCPPGNYCPKNADLPIPTDKGYFASGYGNVQQEPCPPGTFSNETEVSECTVCPAGYECTSEATIEPSLCQAGTYKEENTNLIYCQLCPQGTWSDQTGLTSQSQCTDWEPKIVCILEGMTSLDQAIDCPEGYVWPNYRTTSFTMFSNPCPEGYYWGARTSVPSDYNFCDRGLYWPQASTSTGRTQNRCLSGYFCPLGTAANLNAQGTFEKIYQIPDAYALEGTPAYPSCDDDAALPKELIDLYIANGTQLKCPIGTTSARGSWCLGQWQSTSTTEIVDVFNPVNGSSTIDGEININGEDTDFTGRMLATDPLNVPLYEYTLESLYTAKVYMDFSELPDSFTYNEHFRVAVIDQDEIELALPQYFISGSEMNRQLGKFFILNF
jgi:hypothetical protein